MNPKKANLLFLCSLIYETVMVFALALCADRIQIGMVGSLLLSQSVIFVPAVLFLAGTRTNPVRFIQHKPIKVSTGFMIVGFTYLCLPLIILVNAISMLFVENEVNQMMESMINLPALLMIFLIGVLGPLNEEFVFRGVIYHSYRSKGRIIGGMVLSGVLFGLTHLNFNQMSYAILVGIIGVMLIECTGNILSSIIFHMVINLTNTIPVFLNPESFTSSEAALQSQLDTLQMSYTEMMCMTIGVYSVIAFITTALACCLLYAIAKREGRLMHIKAVWSTRNSGVREKLWSVPLIIAVILCLAYMTLDVMFL